MNAIDGIIRERRELWTRMKETADEAARSSRDFSQEDIRDWQNAMARLWHLDQMIKGMRGKRLYQPLRIVKVKD